jgi:hypothetical protein
MDKYEQELECLREFCRQYQMEIAQLKVEVDELEIQLYQQAKTTRERESDKYINSPKKVKWEDIFDCLQENEKLSVVSAMAIANRFNEVIVVSQQPTQEPVKQESKGIEIGEVNNKYGDPEAFAERSYYIDEQLLQKVAIGSKIFALQDQIAVMNDAAKYHNETIGRITDRLHAEIAAQAKRIAEQLEAIEATAEFAKVFWEKADKNRDTRVMVSTFQQLEQKLRTYLPTQKGTE